MPRDFHTLKAWQEADDLVLEIYRATDRGFPDNERYGLTSQLRRAAVSVAANLAEGCGRRTEAEFLQFLFVARGSLSEGEYYLHVAHRLGYLADGTFAQLNLRRDTVGKLLTGLISSVSRQIAAKRG